MKLHRNPEITFGRDKVGGIEISALSNLAKPLTVALTATRGKRKNFSVEPLPAPTPAPEGKTPHEWRRLADAADGDEATLRNLYTDAQTRGADPETLTYIRNSVTPTKEA